MKLENQPHLKGFTVQYQLEKGLYLSKGPKIYFYDFLTDKINYLGTVPVSFKHRILSNSSIISRLLRLKIYNIVPISENELFVCFNKWQFVLSDGKWSMIKGVDRPFKILRGGVAKTLKSTLYFGEYISNPERKEMRVYKLKSGSKVATVAYTFDSNEIRHIHGVHYDSFDNSIWVLTGDIGTECLIGRTYNDFSSFEIIGRGDETWRAITPCFTKNNIYYAMDAEFVQNHVLKIERDSLARTIIGNVNGPSYYSATLGETVLIGSTSELCPSQSSAESQILEVANDQLKLISKYKKDFFGMRFFVKYFQAGLIEFSYNSDNTPIQYFSSQGLIGIRKKVFKVIVE
ncbi:hypothetical protein [uncultured Cocleimonas sp.]|uniref:hypothetical protein n=1 Tax=uncultured Cocleimonas sp. TaxID=1051587 RepID=UPI00262F36BB|nr:hypothetical protein [uncultured Cocleimonas sp.]